MEQPNRLVTGPRSAKRYQCTRCGHEQVETTNHWGEFYDRCPNCSWKHPMDAVVTWKCLEQPPPGYGTPEPWKTVRLQDLFR